jgi:penicillin amidase
LPDAGADLALRWAVHDPNNHLRAVLGICRATNWESFQQAARDWAFPSQNLVYADVQGHIGYLMPGRVPQRAQGHGLVPAPGWTSDYEWRGWIPADELPGRFNPPEGFVVTANNHVVADDYPHFICGDWLPPYRAQRIASLLQAQTPLDVEATARIQNDTVSLLMRRFIRLATPLLPERNESSPLHQQARALLLGWEGDMDAESCAATVAFAWFVHYLHAVIGQALGSELAASLAQAHQPERFSASPFQELSQELVLCWLADGAPAWVGDVEPLVDPAFAAAVSAIVRHLGPNPARWQWGRLHVVRLSSDLSRIPLAGQFWRPRTLPVGGDGYTVNQAEVAPVFPPGPADVIASCRMIIDVGEWDNCLSALPGGQSGHPASKHYQDHIDDWRHGRYHPMLFSRAAIEREAEGQLTLQPADLSRERKE